MEAPATQPPPPAGQRLRTQLSVAIALPVTVTVLVLSGYFISSYQDDAKRQMETNRLTMEADLEQKGMAVARTVTLAIQRALVVLDYLAITEVINTVVNQDPDIMYGIAMNNDGIAVVHSDPAQSATKRDAPADRKALAATALIRLDITYQNRPVVEIVSPIEDASGKWGVLRFGLSRERLDEAIAARRAAANERIEQDITSAAVAALILIAIACFVGFLLAGRLVGPLQKLLVGVDRVRDGDLRTRLQPSGSFEVQKLGHAFNAMTLAVSERDAALQEHRALLEQKVEERTADLSKEMLGHKRARDELQQAQSRLIQAEKMSSLGELVAGVAHEINNPVNFVQNNHQCVKDAVEDIEAKLRRVIPNEGHGKRIWALLEEPFDVVQKSSENHVIGTNRITKIVQSLLAFSRHDEAEFKHANINELLTETLVIIHNQAKQVTVHEEYGSLPEIECHASQISQVLLNVLTNGIYAAERGTSGAQPAIWIKTWSENRSAHIEIRDNGPGIPEDVQNNLFDPFVTTKPVGEGTGMGLSICYNIITDHGGSIMVDNGKSAGAIFKIVIPIEQPEAEERGDIDAS